MGKFLQHKLTMIAIAIVALICIWADEIGPAILIIGFYFLMRLIFKNPSEKLKAKTNLWVKIYSSPKPFEAEIVAGNLKSQGLEAVVVNKKSTPYNMFGEAEVNVRETDAERALEIIKARNPGEV